VPPALPSGWVWTRLGEITEIVMGQSPPSTTYNQDGLGLPFYQGKAEFGDLYPTPRRWCTAPQKIAHKDDVLVSVRAPVGPANLCPAQACIGRGLAALRGLGGIRPAFVLYLMRAFEDALAGQGTGTTFKAITSGQLQGFQVPLPPPAEQGRIVARIEELFARLDAGLAALEQVQAQLRRYQQAVLNAALTGALTCEWRNAHREELEPAPLLLERALVARRAGGEAAHPGQRYRSPLPPDAEGLPELPRGWTWAALGQLLKRIDAGRSPRAQNRPARDGEFGVLKVSAVSWERFLPGENKALLPGSTPGDAPTLRAGDLLVSRANTAGLVGAAVLVDRDYPNLMLSDKTLRLVPASEQISHIYLLYALTSPLVRRYFARQATGTSDSMRNLSQAKLRATPIPFPPLAEQHRIVVEVEQRLSVADVTKDIIAQSLEHARRLRRSILKHAFQGKLVPQHPGDEPACVLLARIEAERKSCGQRG
jgi:type I restriction enzyme S subunit